MSINYTATPTATVIKQLCFTIEFNINPIGEEKEYKWYSSIRDDESKHYTLASKLMLFDGDEENRDLYHDSISLDLLLRPIMKTNFTDIYKTMQEKKDFIDRGYMTNEELYSLLQGM
jgi:hypothetical protein